MRHIPDGVLRRLDDEPLAVPDRAAEHAATCERCRARRAQIAEDTELAARALSAPRLVPDTDLAWARIQRELSRGPQQRVGRRGAAHGLGRPARFPAVSLRAGLAMGAVGVVIAGTAAAASLTTIFAPTHVASVTVSRGALRAIAGFIDLSDSHALGGFTTPSGSSPTRFGTIKWSSSGAAQPASSLSQATQQAGIPVSLPSRRPAGVGAPDQFVVQPRMSATVAFNSTAAGVAGSSVTLEVGPAVLVQYAGTSGTGLPTLVVATMRRPTARSTGASMSAIEAFLLGQPNVPPELSEEVRLLGDLRTTLPVPIPPGVASRSVEVGGSHGVLLADPSNAAGAVVWEDGRGMIHVVAGLLDSHDLLDVAAQLG